MREWGLSEEQEPKGSRVVENKWGGRAALGAGQFCTNHSPSGYRFLLFKIYRKVHRKHIFTHDI